MGRDPTIKKAMILLLFVLLLPFVIYIFVVSGAGFMFNTKPPKPTTEYGEVPFKLTYEVNGEERVIEDTIICEFDGYENLGSNGTYRKWNTSLKSGNQHVVFLDVRSENELAWGEYPILEFFSFMVMRHIIWIEKKAGFEHLNRLTSYTLFIKMERRRAPLS